MVNKKIIEFSFDNPAPEYLDRNLEQIETYVPHDGMGIDISKRITLPNGKKTWSTYYDFSKVKYLREWYQSDIEHLKKVNTRAKHLKYNFIKTVASSFTGEFDLFDDELWDTVCDKYSIFARVAKQGGCTGLAVDLEDYGNQQLWRYRPSRDRSWDEAWEKARARGRQWMNAIAKEYPEITIFLFYSLDLMLGEADGSAYMYHRLSGNRSGLLVAFFNGIYDVLPPKAKIVDGMEGYGYEAHSLNCYYQMRALRNERFPQFLSPENRRKFQTQGSLACAIYTSYYYQEKSHFRKYIEEEAVTPVEFFRRNFAWAVQYSDEYAWTWSSHRKWFPMKFRHAWQEKKLNDSPAVPGPYMGMALPGVEDIFNYVRDPWKYAMDRLKNESFQNLAKNPGFESAVSDHGNTPVPDSEHIQGIQPWDSWQKEKSKGSFSLAKGEGMNGSNALRVKGIRRGCAMQTVKIDPYALYVVRACAKTMGKGCASLIIQWKKQKRVWCSTSMNVSAPFDEDLGNGWKRATLVIRNIPEDARYLSPMLYSYVGGPDDAVLFDNVEVFNIFERPQPVAPHLREAMEQWKKSALEPGKSDTKNNNIEKEKKSMNKASKLSAGMLAACVVAVGGDQVAELKTAADLVNPKAVTEANGVMTVKGARSLYSKNLFKLDPAKKYQISGEFRKAAGPAPTVYLGFAPADSQKRGISPVMVNAVPNTQTEIAVDAAKGSKILKVKDASKWDASIAHGVIAFNAKEDYSDLPNRNFIPIPANGIEQDGDVWKIRLKTPLGTDVAAGTKVRQQKSGAAAIYTAGAVSLKNDEWTLRKGVISGMAKSGTLANKLWAGTEYVRIIIMVSKVPGDTLTEIRNIKVEEIP